MFQWNITLSDKQVIMLVAFNVAEYDQHGSQFHAVNSMVGDAWDCRAVRKLEEMNLIAIARATHPDTNLPTNIWTITDKGRLIAGAIACDADNLKAIQFRNGLDARRLVNESGDKKWMKSRDKSIKKQQNKILATITSQRIPDGWRIVTEGNDQVGDQYFSIGRNKWMKVEKRRKKAYQYRLLIRHKH